MDSKKTKKTVRLTPCYVFAVVALAVVLSLLAAIHPRGNQFVAESVVRVLPGKSDRAPLASVEQEARDRMLESNVVGTSNVGQALDMLSPAILKEAGIGEYPIEELAELVSSRVGVAVERMPEEDAELVSIRYASKSQPLAVALTKVLANQLVDAFAADGAIAESQRQEKDARIADLKRQISALRNAQQELISTAVAAATPGIDTADSGTGTKVNESPVDPEPLVVESDSFATTDPADRTETSDEWPNLDSESEDVPFPEMSADRSATTPADTDFEAHEPSSGNPPAVVVDVRPVDSPNSKAGFGTTLSRQNNLPRDDSFATDSAGFDPPGDQIGNRGLDVPSMEQNEFDSDFEPSMVNVPNQTQDGEAPSDGRRGSGSDIAGPSNASQPKVPEVYALNPKWSAISTALSRARLQMQRMMLDMTPRHPSVMDLQDQIEQLEQLLEKTPQYLPSGAVQPQPTLTPLPQETVDNDPACAPLWLIPVSQPVELIAGPAIVNVGYEEAEARLSAMSSSAYRELNDKIKTTKAQLASAINDRAASESKPAAGSAELVERAKLVDSQCPAVSVHDLLTMFLPACLFGTVCVFARKKSELPAVLYSLKDVQQTLDVPIMGSISTKNGPGILMPEPGGALPIVRWIVFVCEMICVAAAVLVMISIFQIPGYLQQFLGNPFSAFVTSFDFVMQFVFHM